MGSKLPHSKKGSILGDQVLKSSPLQRRGCGFLWCSNPMSAPRPNSPVSQDRSVNTTGLNLLQTETRHQLKTEEFLPQIKEYLKEKNISKRRISKRRILHSNKLVRGKICLIQRKLNISREVIKCAGDFRNHSHRKSFNKLRNFTGFSVLILCTMVPF